jgi:ribose transport system permease protein
MVGLVGAVIGLAYGSTHNIYLGMLAGLGLAIAVGIVTGIVVSRWGLSSIMVTLGTYIWARGLTIGANNGSPIVVGGGLAGVVNASYAGFTLTAPLLLVVYLGGWLLLTRTRMGRYTHAMGGDPTAARRSGVRVEVYTTLIFVLMAVMIAIAALITVGQLGSAASSAGTGLELNAIVAVMIGGSRLAGGEGSVGRTALGVCFLSILSSGLLNLGLSQAYYQLLEGVALLAILSVQVWLRRIAGTGVRRGRGNVQQVAEPAIS